MVPEHSHRAEDRPSNVACEVSCRTGPWKWTGRWLPTFLRPALGLSTQGCWVPRATILEGMAASAALLSTHERGILSKRRLKINREHGLDMGGDFSFFQVKSHRLEAVFCRRLACC